MKDFVIRNVKRVNGEEIDIVIEDGKIAQIEKAGYGRGKHVLDYSGAYVSSGWIDLHVHAFPEFDPYGDEIDEIGVKQGVTTIVDAGSCGADRISDLAASRKKAKTNLYAFLNISRIGLKRVDELSNLEWIDKGKVVQAVKDYKEVIVGLKARISKSVVCESGIEPLRIARALSTETSLPLMVHIGSGPPTIDEIIPLLEKRDIITHYLNGKQNNLFDAKGNPLQVFKDAIERGVHLDVGHGTASFSFKVAEAAKRHHIGLNTISTDIYRKNRMNGPVYSMANVLTKFLSLGYSLEEVIAAVTTNAANWLKKLELGRIKVGDVANITLFTVQNEPIILTDSEGEKRVADRRIVTKGVVANGEFIEC
ncbi:amidohydrolase/deacetylase family metallohydrolase [Metabacillus sediminilitoris]|uniref:Amidohydrolase/deacetylase family metallohydrolase n=1 Tax=Metabacillus sediminilitoris TaxID=2567941 RepID=A0A4S4C151_9BACI|nr:amidohydrolase/deacetylase family metallohydrolase [Metabacillus sediminilitoris]QGQ48292.1 amidohydrolase/deacetylase family metallohydrolase [Metabacillus sediminilitoris]THF81350.1 amidohydrolase/deacetylase family metallohydrolase [Metabacillus sediminilitoris]